MTWTWNNHSKPNRVILDFEKPIQEVVNQTIKEMNLIDEFKDEPNLKEILDNVEDLIMKHYHCYLMERDEGGTVEYCWGEVYDTK